MANLPVQTTTIAEWAIWNESIVDGIALAAFAVGFLLAIIEIRLWARPKNAPAFIKRLSRSRSLPSAMGVFWIVLGIVLLALSAAALSGTWLAPGLSDVEQLGLGEAALQLAGVAALAIFCGVLHWKLGA